METVLITGGTGMIGKALTEALIERGFNVIILTRHINNKQKTKNEKLTYAVWDVGMQTLDKNAFAKADYIIHLAGASVAEKRWNTKRKQEIVSSRVDSGKLIVGSLKTSSNKIKTVISASGVGWYRPDPPSPPGEGRGVRLEGDPSSNDFLGQTCKQWEAAIEPVSFLGRRLVKFRIGVVLSNEGGAYPEFKKPLRFGLATILGSGQQVVSWIAIDDLIRIYTEAIENQNWNGVFNAVAPEPVSNKELVLQIAKQQKISVPFHVPSFVLK